MTLMKIRVSGSQIFRMRSAVLHSFLNSGCDDPRRADAGGPAEGGDPDHRGGHRALLPTRALRPPALRLLARQVQTSFF